MSKLTGKIALITGGNSGIGLATAKEFVGEGAYVFITARRATELDKATKEIGKNVTAVPGDVSKLGDLDRLFARISQEKGRLDILFANAGIAKYAALGDITEDFYEEIFSINVKGLLFTVQKALPLLPDGAVIILTSSIVGSKGLPANSVYAATKAVARSFARTWTTDLKHRRSRERDQSGIHQHAGPEQPLAIVTSGRGAPKNDRGSYPTGQARNARRGRQGSRVSRIRRRRLHHGNRTIR